MIVTRRRRKPFPLWRVLIPVLIVALLVAAVVWPTSRNAIVKSPLAAPFDLAAAHHDVATRDAKIAALQAQLGSAKTRAAATAQRIAQLQAQLNARAAEAAKPGLRPVDVPIAQPSPAAFPQASPAAASDLAAGATPDMRRTAADWAAMDPQNAAKVVERLPAPYVARVFALMQPDAAGAILDALPPRSAAALTQEDPQLQR